MSIGEGLEAWRRGRWRSKGLGRVGWSMEEQGGTVERGAEAADCGAPPHLRGAAEGGAE